MDSFNDPWNQIEAITNLWSYRLIMFLVERCVGLVGSKPLGDLEGMCERRNTFGIDGLHEVDQSNDGG